MKLLINGKYEKVGFFSFMKCMYMVEMSLILALYILIFLISLFL